MITLTPGMRVRDTKWDGSFTGTIVRVTASSVFVAWDGICVEDELDFLDVEPLGSAGDPDSRPGLDVTAGRW
jgi:hypothetical protein